jgi:hypothetical protein
MRVNRRLWRWAIILSLPLVLKAGLGCAQVAGIHFAEDDKGCHNGEQDKGETGIDCGGRCAACSKAKCSEGSACASGRCEKGLCAEPRCDDGIFNGVEIASDDCPNSMRCVSGKCSPGPAAPTCSDGMVNGNETDTDCGGDDPGCARCERDKVCKQDQDCANGWCPAGKCECALCGDFIKREGKPENKNVLCHVEVYEALETCACAAASGCRLPCGVAACDRLSAEACQGCLGMQDTGCASELDSCKNDGL